MVSFFLSFFLSFVLFFVFLSKKEKIRKGFDGFKLHLETMLSFSQGGCAVSTPAIQNMDSQASYSEGENFSMRPVLQCFSAGLISLVLTCGLVISRPVQIGGVLPYPCSPSSCTLYSAFCYKLAVYPQTGPLLDTGGWWGGEESQQKADSVLTPSSSRQIFHGCLHPSLNLVSPRLSRNLKSRQDHSLHFLNSYYATGVMFP